MGENETGAVEPVRHARGLTWFGFVISGLYIGLVVFYVSYTWPLVTTMEPNEIGDALAGVFAPLAFLWLVLGFMQQGDELKNSVDALKLQGDELRNSVEQQRELVKVTREQLKAEAEVRKMNADQQERDAQPKLSLRHEHATNAVISGLRVYLSSLGPLCTDMVAEMRGSEAHELHNADRGQLCTWFVRLEPDFNHRTLEFEIKYTDRRGVRMFQDFKIEIVRARDGMIEIGRTRHICTHPVEDDDWED